MKTQITLALLLLIAVSADSQMITNYTSADGLANDAVNDVAVDPDGHVWFATQAGLTKYDGSTWTTFDLDNSPDMIDDQLSCVTTDAAGGIWIGSDFGISYFEGSTWTNYDETNGLADQRVNHIFVDATGTVWVAHNDGVSYLENGNWASYDRNDGLPFGGVSYTTEDENGEKYFGTPLGGVFYRNGGAFFSFTESDGLLNDRVRSIAIDQNNEKWVATSDGISVFDQDNMHIGNATRVLTLPPPDTLNPIEDVKIDSKGNIWAGIYVDYLVTEGGVSYFDGSDWTEFDVNRGLVGPVVRRLAIDQNDDVWVATSTGVSKISLQSTSTADNFELSLSVYPNPASEYLMVNVQGISEYSNAIKIYNSAGQLVHSQAINNSSSLARIDISDLDSGVYHVLAANKVGKIVVAN